MNKILKNRFNQMARSHLNSKLKDIKTLLSTIDFTEFDRINKEEMEELKRLCVEDSV